MRTVFLSPFYPFRGGIAQFSNSLYLALKKEHEVEALTFTRQYPKLLFPGSTQYVLKDDINRGIIAKAVLDSINPFSYKKTAKMVLEYKPDLFLTSYWMPFFAPSLGWVAKKLRKKGIKTMSILHNVLPHEKTIGDKALTKYFLKHYDGFILLNKSSEIDLTTLKPDAKYVIHPHPIYDHYGDKVNKDASRAKLNIPQDKKVILFFGFIRDYKGLDLLIEAMKYLSEEYLLLIAGEVYGSFRKYEEIIEKNSLKNRTHLHIKYIAENEVAEFFSASDVCVFPYRSATQSGIVGISYHFEIPVIVTNVGGLYESVENNKTGLVVPELNPKSIAETIQSYFESNLEPSFRSQIISYKIKTSWDSLSETLIKLYESIHPI